MVSSSDSNQAQVYNQNQSPASVLNRQVVSKAMSASCRRWKAATTSRGLSRWVAAHATALMGGMSATEIVAAARLHDLVAFQCSFLLLLRIRGGLTDQIGLDALSSN
jgi:hypothetical protein